MKLYLLFLLVATATVASPGPGVMLSLNNALRLGWRGSLPGIAGVAAGAAVVAGLSATSLGLLLAQSPLAFTVIKLLGAAYLVWLGIKLWRAPAQDWADEAGAPVLSPRRRFLEGLMLQFTNPKAIVFFLSILPQFVDSAHAAGPQLLLLVLSYAGLVLVIHSLYAWAAQSVRQFLGSARGRRWFQRGSGMVFIGFGLMLARSSR
ncbi:LysE family translocator [Mitsuaria sp. WAJ17]|uniref:LysE family translocator n=1 Tax=Mitsuaria sp. WAJ17 TaxID=2761452 RepID=UPI0016041F0C|nr:LysE family translocator [Mitsuaria sp. WAJ17]MBB2485515.1 LysE family translocator [Mitsuaria sp. WAJ17]